MATLLLLGAKRELLMSFTLFLFSGLLQELHSSLCHDAPPKLVTDTHTHASLKDTIFMLVYFSIHPARFSWLPEQVPDGTGTCFCSCSVATSLPFSRIVEPALTFDAARARQRAPGRKNRGSALAGGGLCRFASPAHQLLMSLKPRMLLQLQQGRSITPQARACACARACVCVWAGL